jgi:tRNA nucleotidyltransferase (CCA-adding enzyme)
MTFNRNPAPGWEHFPHGADIGIRGFGPTPDAAFEQAAMALTGVVADPTEVAGNDAVEITCSAPDREVLLVDWLNTLIYEMATRSMLFGRYRVRIDGSRLTATAFGEPLDNARHRPVVEVKGATFTELEVKPSNGGWLAQCVIDV